MQTFFYSILHFLTDGLCALALYSRFAGSGQWAVYVLFYDFCAFVLQMPFGALMDVMKVRMPEKAEKLPFYCALAGAGLTVAGAFVHPVVLGIGNALFHVGGGIGTIREDREYRLDGAALGIFVAPGAMGLYLGTYLGQSPDGAWCTRVILVTAAVYLLLFMVFWMVYYKRGIRGKAVREQEKDAVSGGLRKPVAPVTKAAVLAAALCFLVVMLRSYAGFAITFSWKTGFLWGFFLTLAVVLGKMAGGILAARFGAGEVMTVSLILAAIGYLFSDVPAAGIAALFFFNMTMPVTLYMVADRFRGLEGFSFGLLTVALFLGVLPTFFGGQPLLPGRWLGAGVSLLSLLLLLAASRLLGRGKPWRS